MQKQGEDECTEEQGGGAATGRLLRPSSFALSGDKKLESNVLSLPPNLSAIAAATTAKIEANTANNLAAGVISTPRAIPRPMSMVSLSTNTESPMLPRANLDLPKLAQPIKNPNIVPQVSSLSVLQPTRPSVPPRASENSSSSLALTSPLFLQIANIPRGNQAAQNDNKPNN